MESWERDALEEARAAVEAGEIAVLPWTFPGTVTATHSLATLPTQADELRALLHHIDIHPSGLSFLSFAEYADQCADMRREVFYLPVRDRERPLEIRIINIVMRGMLIRRWEQLTEEFCLPFDRIRKRLVHPYGITTNQRKFKSIQVAFEDPYSGTCFIYGAGEIDCKGSNNLLVAYLLIEWVIARLRREVGLGCRKFEVEPAQVHNLVSTMAMDFVPNLELIKQMYPENIPTRAKNKLAKKILKQQSFPGIMFVIYHANGSKTTFLIFARNSVTCVGETNQHDMLEAFAQFYELMRHVKARQECK